MSTAPRKPAWARDLPDVTPEGEPIVYGARPLSPRLRAVLVEPSAQAGGVSVLLAVFANGEARRLDLSSLVAAAPFAPLRDFAEAKRLTVMPYGHGIEWACGADAPADYLYEKGEPVEAVVAVPEPSPSAT